MLATEHALIKSTRCASVNGFTLHANRYVGEKERSKLEDLLSYAARPAFSNKRLSLKDPQNIAGDFVYELMSQWTAVPGRSNFLETSCLRNSRL